MDESTADIYKKPTEWLNEAYAYVDDAAEAYDFTLLATLIENCLNVAKKQKAAPDVCKFKSFMKKMINEKIHSLRLICMLSGSISNDMVEKTVEWRKFVNEIVITKFPLPRVSP